MRGTVRSGGAQPPGANPCYCISPTKVSTSGGSQAGGRVVVPTRCDALGQRPRREVRAARSRLSGRWTVPTPDQSSRSSAAWSDSLARRPMSPVDYRGRCDLHPVLRRGVGSHRPATTTFLFVTTAHVAVPRTRVGLSWGSGSPTRLPFLAWPPLTAEPRRHPEGRSRALTRGGVARLRLQGCAARPKHDAVPRRRFQTGRHHRRTVGVYSCPGGALRQSVGALIGNRSRHIFQRRSQAALPLGL